MQPAVRKYFAGIKHANMLILYTRNLTAQGIDTLRYHCDKMMTEGN